ncbi:MAG: exopolysaccharide biosynthesis polyprenyl glycosylphosphotransferase [Alphaproteobacteria bacterium]
MATLKKNTQFSAGAGAPSSTPNEDPRRKPRPAESFENFKSRIEANIADSSNAGAHSETNQAQSAQDHKVPAPIIRQSLDEIVVGRNAINGPALKFSLRVSDSVWIAAIIMISVWSGYIGTNGRSVLAPVAVGLFGTAIFITTLLSSGVHRFHPQEDYVAHQKKVFFASFASLGVWLSSALILKPATFSPNALAWAGLLAAAGLFLLHSLYYLHIRRLHSVQALAPKIVMLGATESARRLIEANIRSGDLNILAIFDDRVSRAPAYIHGVPVVGKVQDLLAWKELPYIDRIVVTLPSMAAHRKQVLIEQVRLLPNRIAFLVDDFETMGHVNKRLTQIANISMQDLTGKPKSARHTAMKRVMDILISGTALVLGAPVLALIALLIKLDSPGPALFKQVRHGFNNREFEVYKFRSLRVEHEDKQAASQVTAGDSRVTKIGRFIRKTSLDELPQLVNVLKGDMSLVGPRPHAIGMKTGNIESYKLVEDYAHRHKVKPGMTGWAQINGSRGPLHDAAGVARRVQLDVEYIERASVLFDLMIMVKTLPCLLGDSENIR